MKSVSELDTGPVRGNSGSNDSADDTLKISLPLYEGPFDLLLDLIRKQKIDIYDIPIAQVTQQYLDYLHLIEEMNVNVASDFLLMASELIYIKSRTLLPADPDANLDEEDPRDELVRRLLEYERFKNAAQMLYQRELVEKVSWTRPGRLEIEKQDLEPEITATVFDMMSVFRDILKRFEERPSLDIGKEEFNIEEMTEYIREEIERSPNGTSFRVLMKRFSTRQALITAFLALLELARLRTLTIGQKGIFDDIHIRANPKVERTNVEQSFSLA